MSVDYVVDETLTRTENNHLLDDHGMPNPELTSRSEQALAEIAAVMQKNMDALSGAQLEQVANWAKRWKFLKSRRPMGSRNDFFAVLDVLRNSPEQKRLQKQAYWKMFAAGVSGLVLTITMLSLAMANWTDADMGLGWQFGMGVVLFIAYVCTAAFAAESLMWAKEKDRKYALASLRKAQTVYELNEAGLFTFLPKTRYDEPGYEDREAMRVIRAEVERLTDALYNDPECWLLNYEYPWRN